MKKVFTILAASLILGICIIIAAKQLSPNRSSVAVRGLCEREVPADLAIYPVVFKETGDNLVQLYNTVDQKNKTIVAFLKKNGFEEKEITLYGDPKSYAAIQKYLEENGFKYRVFPVARYVLTPGAILELEIEKHAKVQIGFDKCKEIAEAFMDDMVRHGYIAKDDSDGDAD